jgi:hypothetical protein
LTVLSQLFRRLFLDKLLAAHRAGELQFFGDHAHLTDHQAFAQFVAPLRNCKWVVYCKRPFGGPKQVLRYLARYTPPRRHLKPAVSPSSRDVRSPIRKAMNTPPIGAASRPPIPGVVPGTAIPAATDPLNLHS